MSGQQIAAPPQKTTIRVWNPVIRICHWTLVAAFAIAWLTEDDLLTAHVWAGYAAAGAVLVRLTWGIIGPEQDDLSNFLRPPGEVLRYLGDALRLRSKRYLGHSPAGAVMGLALLVSMAATAGTGMMVLAQEKHAGPLASWFGPSAAQAGPGLIAPARSGGDDDDRGSGGEGHEGGESGIGEVHEFFANLTLILVLLHVTGVALASLSHRENLVRGMITGDKPADAP